MGQEVGLSTGPQLFSAEFLVCSGAMSTPVNAFLRESPGVLLGRVFSQQLLPEGATSEPDPPSLVCVLVPHTGVNKTSAYRFLKFRVAELTLDYFRKSKQGKVPQPSKIIILLLKGHQLGARGHPERGWGGSATGGACPGLCGCETVHVPQG